MILQERFGELGVRFADTPITNYLLSKYSEKKLFSRRTLGKARMAVPDFQPPVYLSSYLEVLSSQIAQIVSAGEVIAVLQRVRTTHARCTTQLSPTCNRPLLHPGTISPAIFVFAPTRCRAHGRGRRKSQNQLVSGRGSP